MPVTTAAPPGRYYADLNPLYDPRPAARRCMRRWVVWERPGPGEGENRRRPLIGMHYQFMSRHAAERAAERLNEQDRRDVEGYP